MKKKLFAAVVVGILIGWASEYAYLRYAAARAFEAQAAFIDSVMKAGRIPAP